MHGQEGKVWGANCASASTGFCSLVLESAESKAASGQVWSLGDNLAGVGRNDG